MIHLRFLFAALLAAILFAALPFAAFAQGCLETPGVAALREEHLDRVNSIRGRHDIPSLSQNSLLDDVAQDYACLLAATGHFDHIGPDDSTLSERIRRGGYKFCVAAENLASGQQSLLEAVVGWVRSPGHYRNLREPSVVDVGFGAAYPDPSSPHSRPVAGAEQQTLGDIVRSFGVHASPTRPGRQNYLWVEVFAAPCDAE
jgi:uncharacterized protein YkwD